MGKVWGTATVFGALGAVLVATPTTARSSQDDDRRDKAKQAKELAEKGQQYAMSKAAEYFAQQQYDKGMQEIGQMMEHKKSSDKNQTAKQDTTGAGQKGRGDGRGQRGPGNTQRPTADGSVRLPASEGLEQQLRPPEPASRGPLLADENETSDDGGSAPPSPEPSDGGGEADRKPADEFLQSLREIRATPPAEVAGPAPARPSPAQSAPQDGRVTLAETAASSAPTEGTGDGRKSAALEARAATGEMVAVSRNWGAAVAAAAGGAVFGVGEEEEIVEGKKIFKRVRRAGDRGATLRDGLEGPMPPVRAQIVDPSQLSQLAKAKH